MTAPEEPAIASLVELRILDGPNLYLPRAAVKLTLDTSALAAIDEAGARAVGAAVGGRLGRPWDRGSQQIPTPRPADVAASAFSTLNRDSPDSVSGTSVSATSGSGWSCPSTRDHAVQHRRGPAAGTDRDRVVEALASFAPGPALNPGRMNVYSLGGVTGVTVIVDLAHNEAGLASLLEVMIGLRGPSARVLLGLGTAGDRTDDILAAMGELAAHDSDRLVIVHKQEYLRGRTTRDMDRVFRAAAAAVGVEDVPSFPNEISGLIALIQQARPGDVVAVMCHQDRAELDAWLRENGGTVDDPEALHRKVVTARG